MARGITQQDVFEAADALLSRGERPTIDRVRQELGSGSPNTINPHLDSWWLALGKRVGGVQSDGLPPSVVQAMTRFYADLRGQALADAQSALVEQQRLAEEAGQALQTAKEEMASENLQLLTAIATIRTELTRLGEANQALTRQTAQQQADVDSAREQANQAAGQLKRAQDELERATVAGRTELERVREQWQGNEKHWLGEIEHLREDAKRLRGEHDRSLKSLQGQVQDLEQQVSAGAKERAQLRVTADKAQRELAQEREKRSFAEGALAAKELQREETALPSRLRRGRTLPRR